MIKALSVLAAGAFVSQTTEYLPVGLLNQIAEHLEISGAKAGTLITVYAWVITLSVIPVTLLTQKIDRKKLFIFLLGLIAVCNGLVMLTDSFIMLLLLRVIAALGHGVFWAGIASYAIKLAGNMPASRATAIVFSGISMAVVMGVPVATAMGNHYGWQQGFGLFGLFSLIIMCFACRWLPSAHETVRKTKPSDVRKPALSGLLCLLAGVTLLLITAHFNSYTYVTVFLPGIAGVNADVLTVLLFVFGVGGACGTVLISRFALRPHILTLAGGAGIALGQALLLTKLPGPLSAGGVMFLWGCAISVVIVGLQSWVIEASRDNPELASALYVMSFNIGIGAGAVTGGRFTGTGDYSDLFLVSIVLSVVGVLLAAAGLLGKRGNAK
ncbi:MFS transporter [Superficieibacter sp.]|uniref:MFS transporter n=1 Tax=Superficieibacter sp. TaxID=2303322 RepID=UPI0028A69122|nr:MFS transporter [Superficieibacter sp.]